VSAPRVYRWKAGRYYPVSAQSFGAWLETLPDRRPETIVKAAANKRCVAHPLFEWRADRAAQEYRLLQARLLHACLEIDVVIYRRDKPETLSVAATVRTSRSGDYDAVEVAMSDSDKRDFVLAQAMAQLQHFKRRYARLSELAVVFAAIEKVQIRRSRASRGR